MALPIFMFGIAFNIVYVNMPNITHDTVHNLQKAHNKAHRIVYGLHFALFLTTKIIALLRPQYAAKHSMLYVKTHLFVYYTQSR